MEQRELNELKTDIALIKKDISQIERFFAKIDASGDNIVSISKAIAIQERVVISHEKRLDDIDSKLERYSTEHEEFRRALQRQFEELKEINKNNIDDMKNVTATERERRHKEVMQSIQTLHGELKLKNADQDQRIEHLLQWKWWSMGVGAAIVAVGSLIWKHFFG